MNNRRDGSLIQCQGGIIRTITGHESYLMPCWRFRQFKWWAPGLLPSSVSTEHECCRTYRSVKRENRSAWQLKQPLALENSPTNNLFDKVLVINVSQRSRHFLWPRSRLAWNELRRTEKTSSARLKQEWHIVLVRADRFLHLAKILVSTTHKERKVKRPKLWPT